MKKVEEDNEAALAFYGGKGFHTLFVDRAARRYDTSGFLLQNVRTSKLTMRKVSSASFTAEEDMHVDDGRNSSERHKFAKRRDLMVIRSFTLHGAEIHG